LQRTIDANGGIATVTYDGYCNTATLIGSSDGLGVLGSMAYDAWTG